MHFVGSQKKKSICSTFCTGVKTQRLCPLSMYLGTKFHYMMRYKIFQHIAVTPGCYKPKN